MSGDPEERGRWKGLRIWVERNESLLERERASYRIRG